MKVLQICSKPPLPAIDGGCKAVNNITQGLLDNNIKVKVLTIATFKHPFVKEKIPTTYLAQTTIESVFVDIKIKISSAFFNLFTNKSYNITRFLSDEFLQLITKTLQHTNFDVILLEGLFVTPYIQSIKKNTKAKIIYRAHNIEYEIWDRQATNEQNIIKKLYLQLLSSRLKKYEKDVLSQIDAVASISLKDKKALLKLGCKKPTAVFPFGINLANYPANSTENNINFFYIGSMDWLPNQEGIKWFLKTVWTKIVLKFPNAQLKLAGKGMPKWLLQWQQKNVVILGQVDDAIQFINQNDVMIVPLFSASGMRIKIIEGMALNKTVITTSIGAEGINCEHNKDILIADTEKSFIKNMSKCLLDKTFNSKIGNEARKTIATKYDNQLIVKQFIKFIANLQ